jgi:hypothetical protein
MNKFLHRRSIGPFFLIALTLFALLFVDVVRARRVCFVSNIEHTRADLDQRSPTGYAQGLRWFISPGYLDRTYTLIEQTQTILSGGAIRTRHVEVENAPFGHQTRTPSLYRWIISLVAMTIRQISGLPRGVSAEYASLFVDPILHFALISSTCAFVIWRFGIRAASVLALGLTTIFPLAYSFTPGVLDDRVLGWIFAIWTILPLVAALVVVEIGGKGQWCGEIANSRWSLQPRNLSVISGIAGGIGLWIAPTCEAMVLLGVAIGAAAAFVFARSISPSKSPHRRAMIPWRVWAIAGATTSLCGYLMEYAPNHLEFDVQSNHPIYGLFWLGIGEALTLLDCRTPNGPRRRAYTIYIRASLALAATVVLIFLKAKSGPAGLLGDDQYSPQFSNLPEFAITTSLLSAIIDHLSTPQIVAICLSIAVVAALVLQASNSPDIHPPLSSAILSSVVGLSLLAGFFSAVWLNLFDAMALLFLTTCLSERPNNSKNWRDWMIFALAIVCFTFATVGFFRAGPPLMANELTTREAEQLLDRELAHWISAHVDSQDAVVLSPPSLTIPFCFHSGLRGIATANSENQEGMNSAIRILSSTSPEEAKARLEERGVVYILLPSWHSDLTNLVDLNATRSEDTFLSAIDRWSLPPWLRPIPYIVPTVPGIREHSLKILQVTDENRRSVSLARLADYFIEMNIQDKATAAAIGLERYPTEIAALTAQYAFQRSFGDGTRQSQVFKMILTGLNNNLDRALPWDRRVSLAVALVQGNRYDLADSQIHRCLEQVDTQRLRSLTTLTLFRFLRILRALRLSLPNQQLEQVALNLLPDELRSQL